MTLREVPLKDGTKNLIVIRSYRKPDGKTSTKIVRTLGNTAQLMKEHADPYAWAKSVVKEMTDREKEEKLALKVMLPVKEQLEKEEEVPAERKRRKNIGYFVFSRIYHQFELNMFWNSRQQRRRFQFDANAIFKMLVYNRLLYPDSKKGAWENRGVFFDRCECSLRNVYDALPFFNEHKQELVRRLDEMVEKHYTRDVSMLFYDVTNYYFEIDENDPDELDLNGNVIDTGLRKKGCCKEHRPNPIVQMGLFMDNNGIPVTYELFSGNTHDSKTLIPAIDQVKHHFKDRRNLIIVADKGMMGGDNIAEILSRKQGYIISNSVRKADARFQDWVVDERDYYEFYDTDSGELVCKIKERTIPRRIRISVKNKETGKPTGSHTTGVINERQIVIWSADYAAREKLSRGKVLEKTAKLVNSTSQSAELIPFGSRKYIKKTPRNEKGEVIIPEDYVLEVDEEKVNDEERLDGYYFISTNVAGFDRKAKDARYEDPSSWKFFFNHQERECYFRDDNMLVFNKPVTAEDILDKYHGLWRIEETFRVTKTDLCGRPVYVWRKDTIKAHFLICFTALVFMRLLQFRLGWKYSAGQIQEELRKASGSLCVENYYLFDYYSSILEEIGSLYGIDFSRKFLSRGEIRESLANTKKF